MALDKNTLKEIEKDAKTKGFTWNTEGSKLINGKGDSIKPSSTGKSVDFNGSHYNSVSDYKNSKQHK